MPHASKDPAERRVADLSFAGANIPEELFEPILLYTEYSCSASLILVSKYFATHCRPYFWRVVLLRSHRRMRSLMKLFEGGRKLLGLPVLAFTKMLFLRHDPGDTEPWIHQVGMVLLPRVQQMGMDCTPRVVLSATGSHNIPNGPIALPRTLPSHLFQHYESLTLIAGSFDDGKALLRCLTSMRRLTHVLLGTVTCDTLPEPRVVERLSRKLNLTTIAIEKGTTGNTIITLLQATLKKCPCPAFAHDQLEHKRVVELLMVLRTQWYRKEDPTIVKTAANKYLELDLCHHQIIITPPFSSYSSGSSIHAAQYDCTIRFQDIPTMTRVLGQQIAAHFASLSYLGGIWLEFHDHDHMATCIRALYPFLQELHQHGRTPRFRVIDSDSTHDIHEIFREFGLPLEDPTGQGVNPEEETSDERAKIQYGLVDIDYTCYHFSTTLTNSVIIPQQVYAGGTSFIMGLGVVSFPPIRVVDALRLDAGQGYNVRPPTTAQNRARFILRILWPGYAAWHCSINGRERTAQAAPIPLWKLMKRVAESIQNFYDDMISSPSGHAGEGDWQLIRIQIGRLYLVELHQPTIGSWQPVLEYRPPRV